MNGEIFNSQEEVLIVTGCWREHYNRARPHSSPGYRLPVPETIKPACPIGYASPYVQAGIRVADHLGHRLCDQARVDVARCPQAPRATDDMLHPVRPLAQSRGLGPAAGGVFH